MDRSNKRKRPAAVWAIIKALFSKYQQDNGNIIVSSISFYVLLSFIPFTLLCIFLLGTVITLSNPAVQFEYIIRSILPDQYENAIIERIFRELNFISVSRTLSGPLGFIMLFFFSTRLFSAIRTSFRIIFGRRSRGFLKNRGEEILYTSIFALLQALIFFSFLFSVILQSRLSHTMPHYTDSGLFRFIFLALDMIFTFSMFWVLYYVLSPARKAKTILLGTTLLATVAWHAGRSLFKHYIVYLMKVTAFFGTYGIFIAFLFWTYYSVFVFVCCTELQSILINRLTHGKEPSSPLSPSRP